MKLFYVVLSISMALRSNRHIYLSLTESVAGQVEGFEECKLAQRRRQARQFVY